MDNVSLQNTVLISILLINIHIIISTVVDVIKKRTLDIQITPISFAGLTIEYSTTKRILAIGNIIRLLASLSLFTTIFFSSQVFFVSISLIIFFFNKILIFYTRRLSMDMSDNLEIIILIGLIISNFVDQKLGIQFISLNTLILYFFTGYNKLFSLEWRSGTAIFEVMNTETFGNSKIAKILYQFKFISIILSWSAILLQISFPLCLINKTACLIYLSLGIIFHFKTMFIMKLHSFFWVFMASYPCVLWTSLNL